MVAEGDDLIRAAASRLAHPQAVLSGEAFAACCAALASWVAAQALVCRGVRIAGLGSLIWVAEAKPAPMIVLADGLLSACPHLRAGDGTATSVPGTAAAASRCEDVNAAKLARIYACKPADMAACMQLLMQELRTRLAAGQPLQLDLGAGVLTVRAGVAAFKLSGALRRTLGASCSPGGSQAPAEHAPGPTSAAGGSACDQQAPSHCGSTSRTSCPKLAEYAASEAGLSCTCTATPLTAEALRELDSIAGSSVATATCSLVSRARSGASALTARTTGRAAASTLSRTTRRSEACAAPHTAPAASTAVGGAEAGGAAAPAGDEAAASCDRRPVSMEVAPHTRLLLLQDSRTAARANARVHPATFVLPVGGPSEPAAERPRLGKAARGTIPTSPEANKALALAEARAREEAARVAAQEARVEAQHSRLKAHLDAQAAGILAERRRQQRELAAQLDQQVQEAAAARQRDKQPASGAAGGALLLPQGREGGGDAAARRAEHARQLQQQMQSKQQVATRVKAWQHQQEAQRLAALAVEGVAAEAKRRTAATVHAETLRRMLDQQVQARQARTAAWPDK